MKAILRWILKALLYVAVIGLIEYAISGSVSIYGLTKGLIMVWIVSWAVSKRKPNTD